MNKTVTVNISGIIFNIEETAYPALREYLEAIRLKFSREEGGDEIISDIEARVAELFQEMLGDRNNVVTEKEVSAVIQQLGNPQDYDEPDDENESQPNFKQTSERKRLYRDEDEQVLGGVAAGLAHYFKIDPVIMRIAFVLALFAGFGFLAYIILWIAVPSAKTTSEKLHMKGRSINVDNIRSERGSSSEPTEFNRVTSRFGDVMTDIFRGLGRIFRIIFGVLFIAWAISLVVAAVGALFGFGIFYDGDYTLTQDQIYTYFIPHSSGFELGIVGAFLFVIGLVIGLFYAGLKLLHRMQNSMSAIKWIVPIAMILGAVMVGYGITANVAQVSNSEEERQVIETEFQSGDTLSLDFQYTEGLDLLAKSRHPFPVEYTALRNDELTSGGRVDIVYRPTKDDKMRIEVTRESNGKTNTEAYRNAKNIRYELAMDSSSIALDPFVYYPATDGFRGQNVQFDIYIPDSVTVLANPDFRSQQYYYQKHYAVQNLDGTLYLLDASMDPIHDREYQHSVHVY